MQVRIDLEHQRDYGICLVQNKLNPMINKDKRTQIKFGKMETKNHFTRMRSFAKVGGNYPKFLTICVIQYFHICLLQKNQE